MKNAKPTHTPGQSGTESDSDDDYVKAITEAKEELIAALTQSFKPKLVDRISQLKMANRSLRLRLSKAKFIFKRITRETESFPSCFISDDDEVMSEDNCHHHITPMFLGKKSHQKK